MNTRINTFDVVMTGLFYPISHKSLAEFPGDQNRPLSPKTVWDSQESGTSGSLIQSRLDVCCWSCSWAAQLSFSIYISSLLQQIWPTFQPSCTDACQDQPAAGTGNRAVLCTGRCCQPNMTHLHTGRCQNTVLHGGNTAFVVCKKGDLLRPTAFVKVCGSEKPK